MIEKRDDGIWVVLRETIASHHDVVFDMITTEHGLTQWFPVAATVDLRTGGQIVLGWDARMSRTTTVAILDFDPGGRIVWDWLAGSSETHAPLYWTVTPSVEQGAKVVLEQGPFKDDVESLIAMAVETESWRWQLCNLRTVLEARHDMRKVRPL
jgi:uncharacterized protein YndB with AHSA1/START domain